MVEEIWRSKTDQKISTQETSYIRRETIPGIWPNYFTNPDFLEISGFIYLPQLPFGVRSCEVAIIRPDIIALWTAWWDFLNPSTSMICQIKTVNSEYPFHQSSWMTIIYDYIYTMFKGPNMIWFNFKITHQFHLWRPSMKQFHLPAKGYQLNPKRDGELTACNGTIWHLKVHTNLLWQPRISTTLIDHYIWPTQTMYYCWWFRNPAPVEVGSLSHFFIGFYTCQVVVWDFWTINSMIREIPSNGYHQIFIKLDSPPKKCAQQFNDPWLCHIQLEFASNFSPRGRCWILAQDQFMYRLHETYIWWVASVADRL